MGLLELFFWSTVCIHSVFCLGSCPTPPGMEHLDLPSYVGDWYEIEKNYNLYETSHRRCIDLSISDLGEGRILWNTTWIYEGKREWLTVGGKYEESENSAKLIIRPSPLSPGQRYWVLGTDYDNYAVVWSCADFVFYHYQLVWIFSRKRNLRPQYRGIAYSILEKNGLKLKDLVMVDHCNC